MKKISLISLFFLISCFGNGNFPNPQSGAIGEGPIIESPGTPVFVVSTQDIVAAEVKQGEENLIHLDYEDKSGALAASCSIDTLENLSMTSPCSCDGAGECLVGVTSSSSAIGNGKFNYQITNSSGEKSNLSSVSFKINRPFVTIWDTRNREYAFHPLNQIRLPVVTGTGLVYDFIVEWGDGKSDIVTSANGFTGSFHDYDVPGVYEIKIYGEFPWFYLNGGFEKGKLLEIKSWGSIPWKDFSSAFSGASKLQVTAQDIPDLSRVTSLSAIFSGASALTGASANWNWDTSHIINMEAAFRDAILFNGDIGSWNTYQVINLSFMFLRASSFNRNIGEWNTEMVSSMESMFNSASVFNQDISSWDTSGVTNMTSMFRNAASFNQDLIGWDVGNVSTYNLFSDGASSWSLSQPNF